MNIQAAIPSPFATVSPQASFAGPGAAASAPVAEPASAGVASFAQTLAADAASIKGMGAGAMGGAMGAQQNSPQMMMGPTLTESGFDMDRAFQLTSTKISAGKTDGADLFAAAIASSTEA